MNLELSKVKEILNPYLQELSLYLYDISFYKQANDYILQVLVGKKGGITIDELVMVNEHLSSLLDEIDSDMPEYTLEVSSPGAECELRNEKEISEHVGEYINVKTNDKEYTGDLLSFDNDVVIIRVNLKGRFKNFEIPYNEIKKIRLAVKF